MSLPTPNNPLRTSYFQAEYEDLQSAMETVQDLIERQSIPVFNNIRVALNCTTKVLKENFSIEELGLKDHAQPVRLAHIQIGDKLIRLREAFDTQLSPDPEQDSTSKTAKNGKTRKIRKLSLKEIGMAFRIHVHRDLSSQDLRAICAGHGVNAPLSDLPLDQIFLSFDEFCTLVSEYKNRPNDNSKGWDNVVSKTVHFLSTVIVGPFNKAANWLGHTIFPSRSRTSSNSNLGRRGSSIRDVYLGGSLGGSAWRDHIAIPMLKKSGLTYYSAESCSSSRLIPIEASAMDNSRILLFVIQSTSRSVGAMAQAAYLIGSGCNVVMCVQYIPQDSVMEGEKLTKQAVKDYNRGRSYLSDFANREGVPVFDKIKEAVECVISKCNATK